MQERTATKTWRPPLAPDRSPFFGRTVELASLRSELQSGTRLVSVVGPSGIGKSRLIRQLLRTYEADATAVEVGGADPSRVEGAREAHRPQKAGATRRLVGLAGCRTSGDLEAAVGEALGVAIREGDRLIRAIASRGPLLLVLDNFEDVASDSGDVLHRWLDSCDGLQILVTSLLPVRLEGEVRFELGPLDQQDAIALYLDRAHRAWAGGGLSDEDRGAIEPLVDRLDRSPLAIELAAARVRILPPNALLSRIEDERFGLLQSEESGRHGSLLRALTLTWEYLSASEREVLARCSAFVGGFTLEAAEEAIGPAVGSDNLLSLLDELRQRALLLLDPSTRRFSMYESVRAFAARELERTGLEQAVHERHALLYAERGEEWASRIDGPEVVEAIRWLSAERKNLIAGLYRCLPTRPDLAARLGLALSRLLVFEGPLRAALPELDATLRACRATGDLRGTCSAIRSQALWLARNGQIPEALEAVEAGIESARAGGDDASEAWLLIERGGLRSQTGQIEGGRRDLESAIEIARRLELRLLEGSALQTLGVVDERSSSLERSVAHIEAALAIARKGGHFLLRGRTLYRLMISVGRQERYREARVIYEEAKDVFRQLEDAAFEADALANLGGIELGAGLLDDAERHLLEAMVAERRLGNRRMEALCLGNLGIMALERRDLRQAEQKLLASLVMLRGLDSGRIEAEFLAFLSITEARLAKFEAARRSLAQSRELFADVDRGALALNGLLEIVIDLLEARSLTSAQPAEAALAEASHRERLQAHLESPHLNTDALGIALRLVHAITTPRAASPAAPGGGTLTADPRESPPGALPLVVAPDAAWFSDGDEPPVDLRSRGSCRRILAALVRARLDSPGAGLSRHQLFEAGWEGESIRPEAAAARVYVAVRTLRMLGLEAVILRDETGYHLDPARPLALAGDLREQT